jgi:hypothetical protein
MLPRPKWFDAHRNSVYLAQRSLVIARRMGAAELPGNGSAAPKGNTAAAGRH